MSTRHPEEIIQSQLGFSVLEGMIAAVVLAIGLLALAAMQGFALNRNVDANELSTVTSLGSDMMERIQFNRRNVANYNNIDTTVGATQPPTSGPNGDVMSNGDYVQWQTRLNALRLTNIRGVVTVQNPFGPTALNQSQVTVQVTWTGIAHSGVRLGRRLQLVKVIAPE